MDSYKDAVWVAIQTEDKPLDAQQLVAFVSEKESGALVSFGGVVRASEAGRPIVALVYEHHPVMAERELRRIVEHALEKFGARRIGCVHRSGRVRVGETSVLIVVGAAHRAEAFEACQHIIDQIKRSVPIWKTPVFE